MTDWVDIDGSFGEGGGQILRTSLALSMLTGKPLRMINIRAGRAKPGLRRQHVSCVDAAARLCNARAVGATVDSKQLEFEPGPITTEHLDIDIGSAGSSTLVIQTIITAAISAGHKMRATITGGTHNPMAPPFEFLDRVFVPQLRAMGADVTLTLHRHGFVPAGGGYVEMVIGASKLTPIAITKNQPIESRQATVISARLPSHVADRELAVVRDKLHFDKDQCREQQVSGGPANLVLLEVDRGNVRELVTVHGEKGLRAEVVAERACAEMQAYLDANVPVGEHLADQLLLPLAVAGGGAFRAAHPLSLHATTNIATIGKFLDVAIDDDNGTVTFG